MGLFDKVLKDVTKGLQDAAKAVEEETKAVADGLKDKAAEEAVSDAADTVGKGASDAMDDLKKAVDDLNTSIKEADEATKDVTPEQWEQASSYLDKMAKDALKGMRVCLECDEAVKGDQKFCPKCGAELPVETVMEMAFCRKCNRQNDVGTDFCAGCGAKLPYKEAKDAIQRRKDDKVVEGWREKLPQFPAWSCGGTDFELTRLEEGRYYFGAWFEKDPDGAKAAVEKYREVLKENGFRTAGEYPSDYHLYKMVDGVCCHADTENCFDGGADSPGLYFAIGDEPRGGFNYVKPEPKKKSGDLFGKLFK